MLLPNTLPYPRVYKHMCLYLKMCLMFRIKHMSFKIKKSLFLQAVCAVSKIQMRSELWQYNAEYLIFYLQNCMLNYHYNEHETTL